MGAGVEVEPPTGKFVLPEDTSRALVFVAGGIGITAFRSMLLYIQDEGLPHRVTLIYTSDRESTPFLDELEEIERANPRVRLILTITDDEDWLGERRRVDANFFRDYVGDGLHDARYMVAGPPGLAQQRQMSQRRLALTSLISTDSFSGTNRGSSIAQARANCAVRASSHLTLDSLSPRRESPRQGTGQRAFDAAEMAGCEDSTEDSTT